VNIISVVGARPQFIKSAVVSKAIKQNGSLHEIIVHTGQHYDDNMSKVFFDELDVAPPDYNFGIGSFNHGAQTGRILEALEEVLLKEKPGLCIVYGDTNSTLAGALAAVKLNIPVVHVEAGLRSFNRKMPEEINRVLTDHVSDLLFAPTDTAMQNLANEGISEDKCHLVGDVMYDAALYYGDKAEQKSDILKLLNIRNTNYILITIHRAENTDDAKCLKAIVEGIVEASKDMLIVWPLHPRTKAALIKYGIMSLLGEQEALKVIEPQGYLDMIKLEKNAALIVTDSGGVQKEAYFHEVPCIIVREETEWVELIEKGMNVIIKPFEVKSAFTDIKRFIRNNEGSYNRNLYGLGNTSEKIIDIILKNYNI